jgi:uncharacterized protein (UPF0332 family)
MDEGKLKWCIAQPKGISLIEPRHHLFESYLQEADQTLDNVLLAKGKWKVIMAYYACYHALYALLMRAGIKCEIHDCTIGLMQLFGFSAGHQEFLRDLKEKRIQTQYYLKDIVLGDEKEVKRFVALCKEKGLSLTPQKISSLRSELSQLLGGE